MKKERTRVLATCFAAFSSFIYHTGDERAAIGLTKVTRDAYANPESDNEKHAVCDLRATKGWPRAVTLQEIKAHPQLDDWDLVRLARLSVVPLSDAQWEILQQLAEVTS